MSDALQIPWTVAPLPLPLKEEETRIPRLRYGVHRNRWIALRHAIQSEDQPLVRTLVLGILPDLYRETDSEGNEADPYKVPAGSLIGALVGSYLGPITCFADIHPAIGDFAEAMNESREAILAITPELSINYGSRLVTETRSVKAEVEDFSYRLGGPIERWTLPSTRILCRLGRMRRAEAVAGTVTATPHPIAAVVVAAAWRHLHNQDRAISISSQLIRNGANLPAALTTRAGAYGDIGEHRCAHVDARQAWQLDQNAYIAYALMRAAGAVKDRRSYCDALAYIRTPSTTIP